jgi:hypothetical protein
LADLLVTRLAKVLEPLAHAIERLGLRQADAIVRRPPDVFIGRRGRHGNRHDDAGWLLHLNLSLSIIVGLRAWTPFLPDDLVGSMLPGAVLEMHLRNATWAPQTGTIAFSFPGPLEKEAGDEQFMRKQIAGECRVVRFVPAWHAPTWNAGVASGDSFAMEFAAPDRANRCLPCSP